MCLKRLRMEKPSLFCIFVICVFLLFLVLNLYFIKYDVVNEYFLDQSTGWPSSGYGWPLSFYIKTQGISFGGPQPSPTYSFNYFNLASDVIIWALLSFFICISLFLFKKKILKDNIKYVAIVIIGFFCGIITSFPIFNIPIPFQYWVLFGLVVPSVSGIIINLLTKTDGMK